MPSGLSFEMFKKFAKHHLLFPIAVTDIGSVLVMLAQQHRILWGCSSRQTMVDDDATGVRQKQQETARQDSYESNLWKQNVEVTKCNQATFYFKLCDLTI